jgi:hypothetical protein
MNEALAMKVAKPRGDILEEPIYLIKMELPRFIQFPWKFWLAFGAAANPFFQFLGACG